MKKFDVGKIRKLPQDQRRQAWMTMSKDWGTDVQQAYNYLKNSITSDGKIGVIGASCGGTQAIRLAEKSPVSMISYFSSAQRDENVALYKKVMADKPTLIIAAEDDGNTFTSAQSLFKAAKHNQSQLISYKGGEHGYPLLDQDTDLAHKNCNLVCPPVLISVSCCISGNCFFMSIATDNICYIQIHSIAFKMSLSAYKLALTIIMGASPCFEKF